MDETFGSVLKAIMTRNSISQRELARRASVDHVSLCRILNENYKFTPARTINRLTQHVGCTHEERITLYRLAGIAPPELVEKFCSSQEMALRLLEL